MTVLLSFIPPPPRWIDHASIWFVENAAIWVYWQLTATWLSAYAVLRWQRKRGETPAARWMRRGVCAEGVLWLVLATGRWFLVAWRPTLYALTVLYIAVTGIAFLTALTLTYTVPALRNGDGSGDAPPPGQGGILPPPTGYAGGDRRGPLPGRRATDRGPQVARGMTGRDRARVIAASVLIVLVLGVAVVQSYGGSSATGGPTPHKDVNCSQFATHEQAQAYFVGQGGPKQDPNGLDRDHDGIACEALPTATP